MAGGPVGLLHLPRAKLDESEIYSFEKRWKRTPETKKKFTAFSIVIQTRVRSRQAQRLVATAKMRNMVNAMTSKKTNMAAHLLNTGELDKAIALLSESIDLDASYTHSFRVRGHVYFNQKQYELAIADYSTVVSREPRCKESRNWRSRALGALERWEACMDDLEFLMDIDPASGTYYVRRGHIRSKLQQFRLAVDDFCAAAEKGNLSEKELLSRGCAYCECQDYDHAVRDFTAAVKMNPKGCVTGYYFRGRGYTCLRKWDRAVKDFESALKIRPDFSEVSIALEQVCRPHDPLPIISS